jgi:class 3 adenylate cyclase
MLKELGSRRLAVIVAADVAGYSRLVSRDERETLDAMRSHRSDFIDPMIGKHRGRLANTAGDSLLLEFPSVVDAANFALALQRGMAARNANIADNRRIDFRIGINLGDVFEQAGVKWPREAGPILGPVKFEVRLLDVFSSSR